MSSLPPEVLDLVVFSPIEDLILHHLQAGLPDAINVQSLIESGQTFPLVLPRRAPDWGLWAGDSRFINSGTLSVHTFCEGINADSDAAYLAEAVRVLLYAAVNEVIEDMGHLTLVDMIQAPRRVTDWATATGPVQYADLPAGVSRYETVYELAIRAAPRT